MMVCVVGLEVGFGCCLIVFGEVVVWCILLCVVLLWLFYDVFWFWLFGLVFFGGFFLRGINV